VKYKNKETKVIIICPIHGNFLQRAGEHVRGKGCIYCSGKVRSNNKTFIQRANTIHNGKYDYSEIKYINNSTKIKVICPKHGEFYPTPKNHLTKKSACPACAKKPYSESAISWLEGIASTQHIFIQHAENLGEFLITGTNFHADGFCEETNTIYEFYGDVFHGNPIVFNPDDLCHPYNKNITAKELYQKTIIRETEIKKEGYNLVTIWEHAFKKYS